MTAKTERLYYGDSWLTQFSARVVAHGAWDGRTTVVLDRTAFYPESGGQLGDAGRLGDAAVDDVQVDDAGIVHHIVGDGPLPAVGDEVAGAIDAGRRRVHMSLHTGQHMLSRALLDVAKAETLSSRLGARVCTVDVGRGDVPERELAEAVDLVASVIDDDVEVEAWFPEPGQLDALPLRREPKVTGEIRVVRIGEFDMSPCGGTHCTRTGQVGVVHVQSIEKYKGGLRIYFDCGPRARRDLMVHSSALRELGRGFSCGPEGVADAVDKLRADLYAARGELKQLRLDAAAQVAEELVAGARSAGHAHVVAVLDGGPEVLRAVGKRVTAEPDLACLLASPVDGGTQVLIARGAGSSLDCGATLKRAAAATGGRGGGRPERAEGRLPAGIEWGDLVAGLLRGDGS